VGHVPSKQPPAMTFMHASYKSADCIP
jgi:hypothetical protein